MKRKNKNKIDYSFVQVLTGSDLSSRRLPFMQAESKKAGPTIWLTGCIHGDEVGGMVVIQEMFKKIKKQGLLAGTVYGFPVMNPIGFENISRQITQTHEDVNRLFPGNANGSLGERIAQRIFSTITDTNPDLVLDLHNDWINSIPYTLIDPNPGAGLKKVYDQVRDFAHATGLAVVNEEETPDDRDDLRRSLSGSLIQAGIPALTLELGGSYIVNEEFVDYGVRSITNILVQLKMIDPEPNFTYPVPEKFEDKDLRYSHEPRASKSGVVRFLKKPGEAVKKGDSLAMIYNSFGKHQETVTALFDGLVLGHNDYSVAHPGMELYAFGRK